MAQANAYAIALLRRLRGFREEKGLTQAQLEEQLVLGPGWVESFESGQVFPDLETLIGLLAALDKNLHDLSIGIETPPDHVREVRRHIFATDAGQDVEISFKYADHDAIHRLTGATRAEFDEVIRTLRNGLSRLADANERQTEAIKTAAVADCFLAAVRLWPHANPSDIWWFITSRAYCDPFNHPARFARLDLQQSWKRTGGWALEEVLVRHYGPHLESQGVRIFIANAQEKRNILNNAGLAGRIEADKADVLLTKNSAQGSQFLGVVHVKASFAERRTDDVPLSQALIAAGYCSPLWTVDCKSTPSANPVNRGELGAARSGNRDTRSAKRKDIEDDGYFSACFSYNANTVPTPASQRAHSRIHVCNFGNPDDQFSQFIVSESNRRRRA